MSNEVSSSDSYGAMPPKPAFLDEPVGDFLAADMVLDAAYPECSATRDEIESLLVDREHEN